MRLIDADTLKAEFTGNFNELWHYTGVRAVIDNAPTIDAVPVVRCKECLNSYKCCDGTLRCDNSYGPDNMDREVSADWFCANGERKEVKDDA